MSEQETQAETVAAFAERVGLTMDAKLLGVGPNACDDPEGWSDPRATHWRVTLKLEGRSMSSDYHMGAAYWRWKASPNHWMPSAGKGSKYYGAKKGEQVQGAGSPRTLFDVEYLEKHSEPMPPELVDVLDSLRLDAETTEYEADFEGWANVMGMDTDSRAAEKSYGACCALARKLRALLGRDLYSQLLDTERL